MAAAQPTLVFPATAELDPRPVEDALAARGVEVVRFDALERRLRDAAARARRADAEKLAALQRGLEAAQRAYLEQDWDAALDKLAAIERDGIELLGRPEHRDVSWRVQLSWALVHLARGGPDDAAATRRRVALALAIDADRRPDAALYGPEVVSAFADAAAQPAVTRPVSLSIDPPGARVVIDGIPRLDPGRGVLLAPGLHVVWASAPGRRPAGAVIDSSTGSIALRLEPDRGDAALARAWVDGGLSLDAAPSRDAVAAAARSMGAARVVVIAAASEGARARVIAPAPAGEWRFARAASEAAIAAIGGRDEIIAPPPERPDSGSILGKWWFWTAVGGAAAVATGVGIYAFGIERDTRIRVFVGR
jgi:hypothetical protein